MSFLPEILPAHPQAPEGFPSRRGETPRRWSGLLARRAGERETEIRRKLRHYGL